MQALVRVVQVGLAVPMVESLDDEDEIQRDDAEILELVAALLAGEGAQWRRRPRAGLAAPTLEDGDVVALEDEELLEVIAALVATEGGFSGDGRAGPGGP